MEKLDEFWQLIYHWIILGGLALLGRTMMLISDYRAQRLRIGPELLLEIPVALAMGFIAHGTCEYLNVNGDVEVGVVTLAGYLGPNFLTRIIDKFMFNKYDKSSD